MSRKIPIPQAVIAKFGPNAISDNGKDEVRYYCPECVNRKGTPDRKGHLYVNTKSLVFHCYRCDYAGRIGRTKVDKSILYDEDRNHKTSEMIGDIKDILEDETNSRNFKLKIPIEPVTSSPTATNYMLQRGFTLDQMKYYDMRVGNISREFGRIVIPNQVSRMVYTDMYSARTYIDQVPKYHNPFDVKKSEIVFNLHRIQEGTPIILVEGALTAVAAGYHAVASLGKNLSTSQASQIAMKKPSMIYVNYDYGAEQQSHDACRLLYRLCPGVPIYEVFMKDDRDAADMQLNPGEYVDCLRRAKLYQPMIDNMENIVNGL